MQLTKDALQYLFERGVASSALPEIQTSADGVPFFMTANGPKLAAELAYNDFSERPHRIKQNVSVNDPDSFCGYYTLFGDSQSRVFASEQASTVTAILDYHESHGEAAEGDTARASARWGQHRVVLNLIKSAQWNAWLGANNKHLTQAAFAEFLEQNALDISQPKPADVIEVARDLQATSEVQLSSGARANGQVSFKYTEETRGTLGAGQLTVPERFTVSIPIYLGGPNVSIDCLLRFRIKEGRLEIWYTMVRPDDAQRAAFMAARDLISSKLGVFVINGNPA